MFLGKGSYFFVLLREELLVRMNYSQVAVRYEIAISQNLHDFCSRLSSFYWYLWLYWMYPLELRWCSANCDTESVLQAKFDYVPPQVTWIMTRDEKCDRSRDVLYIWMSERANERAHWNRDEARGRHREEALGIMSDSLAWACTALGVDGEKNAIKRMIRILRSCTHDVMRKRM